MDLNTEQRINSLLDYLGQTAKDGIAFASEQAPLVAKEVATYGAVVGWAKVVIGVFLLAGVAFAIRKALAITKEDNPDYDPKNNWSAFNNKKLGFENGRTIVLLVCSIPVSAFGVSLVAANMDDAMKATFAPRVYVLEYVAKLVK